MDRQQEHQEDCAAQDVERQQFEQAQARQIRTFRFVLLGVVFIFSVVILWTSM
jgi:hypothetical protein